MHQRIRSRFQICNIKEIRLVMSAYQAKILL